MTSWTARIDALLPTHRVMNFANGETFNEPDPVALIDRLALAAERMREPHPWNCGVSNFTELREGRTVGDTVMLEGGLVCGPCTCGLVADLLRILEGR
jgi:hypothetical protein